MKVVQYLFLFSVLCAAISSCTDNNNTTTSQSELPSDDDSNGNNNGNQAVSPLFVNSIVSTNIDFITASDLDTYDSIQFVGLDNKEMPDSRNNQLFDTNTFIFNVTFTSGLDVEIWAHSSFGNVTAAQSYADKLTSRLGKLPLFMRNQLSHVVLHNGDAGAFAESEANFFVIYSDNMDVRITNNDLEETVFHEAVHATLDATYLDSNEWIQAQLLDDAFITQYARNNPDKEDMAETALFVYTMVKHPGRLSTETESWVQTNIPNRYSFLQSIFQ